VYIFICTYKYTFTHTHTHTHTHTQADLYKKRSKMLMANGSDKDAEGNVPDFWATVLQRADAGVCVCVFTKDKKMGHRSPARRRWCGRVTHTHSECSVASRNDAVIPAYLTHVHTLTHSLTHSLTHALSLSHTHTHTHNTHTVNAVVTESDAEVLAYLTDVRASVSKSKEAVTLTFQFLPNPFFKNTTLQREDSIETVLLAGRELRVSVATASEIEWLQRPGGSRQRKKGAKKGGKGGKGGGGGGKKEKEKEKGGGKGKAGDNREEGDAGEEGEEGEDGAEGVGEKVKLEYKNSFFAFFNPPNLRELVPGGASKGFCFF
jgi:hypothetical protein